jgi:hypothetical protein
MTDKSMLKQIVKFAMKDEKNQEFAWKILHLLMLRHTFSPREVAAFEHIAELVAKLEDALFAEREDENERRQSLS